MVVLQRPDLAGRVPRDDGIADPHRSAQDEHRRDRPATDVEARLDDEAGRIRSAVRAQVELGVRDEQDALEEVVEVRLLLRGNLGELRGAAPVLGLEALCGELALDPVHVRVRDVDLVDRDDDRHFGRTGVRDRLLRLRHDAVVRRDDEDGDVRHLRTAGSHRSEGLVAGSVEERDLATVDLDLVRADVLRDAACLGVDDRRLANRIEERRLAVVDVTHDRDDRRTRLQVLLRVVEHLRLELLFGRVLDRDLALELGADHLELLVGERLRRSAHLAESHEDLDQVRHRHAERLREILDVDTRLDRHRPGGRRSGRRLRTRRARGTAPVTRLSAVATASATTLDDDAPLPPAGSRARANGAIRSFAAVSHRGSAYSSSAELSAS